MEAAATTTDISQRILTAYRCPRVDPWMGEIPVRSNEPAAKPRPTGALIVLRFDTRALYSALDAQRRARAMTWRQVAHEVGVTVSTITRTRDGGRLEVDGMLAMVSWLGMPVHAFTRKVP